MPSPHERREALKDVFREAGSCTRCTQLAATRTKVVFGAGNADADLMFVGEAPGANEDRLGLPFVGQAGKLLDTLLAEIGLARESVFIANTLKCRPPGNRDPAPEELANCQGYLYAQLALIRPTVVCTLGNFATKLLRQDTTGISRLHGQAEVRVIGPRAVRLYPLFHPAAALYTPSNVEVLRADMARIPALLVLGPPEQPAAAGADAEAAAAPPVFGEEPGAADASDAPAPDLDAEAESAETEDAPVAPGQPGDQAAAPVPTDDEPVAPGLRPERPEPDPATQLGLF